MCLKFILFLWGDMLRKNNRTKRLSWKLDILAVIVRMINACWYHIVMSWINVPVFRCFSFFLATNFIMVSLISLITIIVYPEHPKHAQWVTCRWVCWPCKNWDVFSFQELCTDPCNMGPCIICCNMRGWSWMNDTTMGLSISSRYLCALKCHQ